MSNFKELVNNTKKEKDLDQYFESFFVKDNYKSYQINDDYDKYEIQAVKAMFNNKKSMDDRIDEAFRLDPLCLEAFYVYFMSSEDAYVSMRFDTYYREAKNYADFTNRQKRAYLCILDYYVEFLLDIHNITMAIKIEKLIMRLSNDSSRTTINRLAFMYSVIEDDEEFYRLYLNYDFDAYDYLLLLVTLLKHEDTLKAEEVLKDMLDNIEYSHYIDHIWDIEKENEKGLEFYQAVDDCFDEISAIPNFFSWTNTVKEKLGYN